MITPLKHLVDNWLAVDRNTETRKEIEQLWAAKNKVELERRLRHRIEFGTAGKCIHVESEDHLVQLFHPPQACVLAWKLVSPE